MKRWKKLLLGTAFLACITGVATGIAFQGNLQRSAMPKEIYEDLLGDALGDEDVPEYEEAVDKDGYLSDEAHEKLMEKMGEQESAVILDCDNVSVPESMAVYHKADLKITYTDDQLLSLLDECAGDNPDGKQYRLSVSPKGGFTSSQETPIAIWHYTEEQRTQGFRYSREWYDLREDNPPEISRDTAVKKAEAFLEKLYSLIGLHCDIMPSDLWTLQKKAVVSDQDEVGWQYKNPGGRDEECYQMEMSCFLDGYPLFSSDNMTYKKNENSVPIYGNIFKLCYGASGWVDMDCIYPYDFQKTKETYRGLLSMKQAAQRLEKRLKLEAKKNGPAVFSVKNAQLGYFVTDARELRPVWCFSGPVHNIMTADGIYIMDAVTGRKLAESRIGKEI